MTGMKPIGTLADLSMRDLTFILFRHRRLLVITVLLVFAIGAAVATFWPPIYGAYGSVLLKGRMLDHDPGSLETGETRSLPVSEADLYSELRILESPALISEALETLAQAGNARVTEALGGDLRQQVGAVREGLSASVVPSSNVIEVTLVHSDRDAALAVLEALFQTYTQYRQRIYRPERVATFLSSQVARLEHELAMKNEEITAHQERTGLVDADSQVRTNLALRREIESSRLRLEEEMMRTDATQRDLAALLESPHVRVFAAMPVEDGVVLQNRAEVAAWLRQLEGRQAATQATLDKLLVEVAAIDQLNHMIRREQLVLADLQREAGVLEAAHEILLTRRAEAMIDAETGDRQFNPYVAIVSPPRLYDGPLFPKPKLVMAIALVAGTLLGLVLAALREVLDPTFSRPVDVAAALGVPVLFSLPKGGGQRTRTTGNTRRPAAPHRRPRHPTPTRAPRAKVAAPGLAGHVRGVVGVTVIAGALVGVVWIWAHQSRQNDGGHWLFGGFAAGEVRAFLPPHGDDGTDG